MQLPTCTYSDEDLTCSIEVNEWTLSKPAFVHKILLQLYPHEYNIKDISYGEIKCIRLRFFSQEVEFGLDGYVDFPFTYDNYKLLHFVKLLYNYKINPKVYDDKIIQSFIFYGKYEDITESKQSTGDEDTEYSCVKIDFFSQKILLTYSENRFDLIKNKYVFEDQCIVTLKNENILKFINEFIKFKNQIISQNIKTYNYYLKQKKKQYKHFKRHNKIIKNLYKTERTLSNK